MEERLKQLEKARKKLKEEFVGLDGVIDRIISAVSPWYLTPDLLERPQIVSIWGLTGTGKSSVVRKLISYLDLGCRSLFFDCGENSDTMGEANSVTKKIEDYFDSNEEDDNLTAVECEPEQLERLGIDPSTVVENRKDCIFVFDEFQNARIRENGEPTPKTSLRGIWTLMDSGIIDITSISWRVGEVLSWIGVLETVSRTFSEVRTVTLGGDMYFHKDLEDSLSLVIESSYSYRRTDYGPNVTEAEKASYPKYKVIPKECLLKLIESLNKFESGLGMIAARRLKECTDFNQVMSLLCDYKRVIQKPRVINCRKSLVFVIGNLDSAFQVSGVTNPDIDADIYHEITEGVTVMDLKNSLKELFNPEQIGRLGNNMIIYPSLTKSNFQEVLRMELSRISEKFQRSTGITIKFSDKFRRCIYSEGVFPSLGVRPLFTTINHFIGSRLSDIAIKKTENPGIEAVEFDVLEEDFNRSNVTITLKYVIPGSEDRITYHTQELDLGKLRDIKKCPTIPLQAIHEAGHAVVYYVLTGNLPDVTVALSADGGGFMCPEMDRKSNLKIKSRRELDNDIKVSLAGWCSEREFFPEDDCSLGSGSDIQKATGQLTQAAYELGYFNPGYYTSEMRPSPMDPAPNAFWEGDESSEIGILVRNRFESLASGTKEIIRGWKGLVLRIANALIRERSIGKEEFGNIARVFSEETGKSLPEKIGDLEYYLEKIKRES